MKKLLALLIAAGFLVGTIGCTGGTTTAPKPPTPTEKPGSGGPTTKAPTDKGGTTPTTKDHTEKGPVTPTEKAPTPATEKKPDTSKETKKETKKD